MKPPTATYRVQLNASFGFTQAQRLVDYLDRLGVSHLYASPIFRARRGSTHGYDIVDPNAVSPELGGEQGYDRLVEELEAHGMGLIQDVVPNHMAYSGENRMLADVLELGAASKHFSHFDVDWDHPCGDLRGRLLAPFLGKRYEECLRDGEVRLEYDGGFKIKYFEHAFPLRAESYPEVLKPKMAQPGQEESLGVEAAAKLRGALETLDGGHSGGAHRSGAAPSEAKETVDMLYREDPSVRRLIEEAAAEVNRDPTRLHRLLAEQNFKLCHWKTAADEINYRRFFNIADLICVRVEQEEVFEETHRLVFRLLAEGKVSGIRVDHVDGLARPRKHLERLRGRAPDAYIVVEKILAYDEELPDTWPVQGTTGYDFLSRVNGLFVDHSNEEAFDALYSELTGQREGYADVAYRCRRRVVESEFAGDVDSLARLFKSALAKRAYGWDCTLREVRRALVELLACLTAYRTYLSEGEAERGDAERLRGALREAQKRSPQAAHVLEALARLLAEAGSSEDALRCFMRLQQYSGAVAAKGLEDTAYYVYNRLISLNEVGGDPGVFGITVEAFHEFNAKRLKKWPHTLNATSTHDTKRGEDVRARIDVLSEIPSEWAAKVRAWVQANLDKKRRVAGRPAPEANEEYYFYQTLVGAYPFDRAELPEFVGRLKAHMVKAAREAKQSTSWLEPNKEYEEALASFVEEVLSPNANSGFLEDFEPFQKKVAFYGAYNSLSQVALKATCPGVPDFYQGTELWDLSLTDPDNRRPVDFEKRRRLLDQVLEAEADPSRLRGLLENYWDGRIKMYVTHVCLRTRREKRPVFEVGDYIPVRVEGARRENIVAYCRRSSEGWVLVAAPRLLTRLVGVGQPPLGEQVWANTSLALPAQAPHTWRDAFTARRVAAGTGGGSIRLRLGEALEAFPLALLIGGG